MSDTKPDLDAIREQIGDTLTPIDEVQRLADELVAYARTLEAEVERQRSTWARAWLAVAHEQEVAIDGATWVRADKIRSALASNSDAAETCTAEVERDQLRDTLELRSAAHNRLAQRLDQIRALVQDMQDGAEREKGPCPDGECGACSIGNAAILILRVIDGDQRTEQP